MPANIKYITTYTYAKNRGGSDDKDCLMSILDVLYISIKLYIATSHKNRLSEAIQIDATMYRKVESKKICHKLISIFLYYLERWYIMTAAEMR